MMLAVFRVERLNYDLVDLSEILEKAGVDFIPLKGSVLRGYYPSAYQRTSCDIDVLVREEDLKSSVKILEENGYKKEEFGSHDVSFFSPSGNHIELHYDLVEDGRANSSKKILSDVWNVAQVKEGKKHYYELPDEMFYFYHVAHAVKHFENGGCGIKPLIDCWVLNHRVEFDSQKRQELLKKGGLDKFERVFQELSEGWFSGKEMSATALKMQNYIVKGGVYGNTENKVRVKRAKSKGKFRYFLSRIFISYDALKYSYPVLIKHKWLMPFMQIARWFRLVFKRDSAKRSINELKINGAVSEKQAEETAEFFSEIGLL